MNFTLILPGIWENFLLLLTSQKKEYASQAVQQILQTHPDAWEVAVIPENRRALSFGAKPLPTLAITTTQRSNEQSVKYTIAENAMYGETEKNFL